MLTLMGCLVLTSCRGPQEPGPAKASRTLKVVAVTNSFLEYCAKSLVDSSVQVVFPLQGNGDPADWEPTLDGLTQLQQADLVIVNGAGYEKWLAGVSLPSSNIRRTANGFRGQWIEVEGVVHSHGPGGAHSHAGTAYTTWIDFEQARLQALEIRQALIDSGADPKATEERYQLLETDLKRLDQDMQKIATRISSQPLVVSHPVFQYWSRRYKLNTRSVHWEPSVAPAAAEQEELQKLLLEFPAKYMIWESEPSEANRALASQYGLTSIVFAPYGARPVDQTWMEAMLGNIRNLENIVETGK